MTERTHIIRGLPSELDGFRVELHAASERADIVLDRPPLNVIAMPHGGSSDPTPKTPGQRPERNDHIPSGPKPDPGTTTSELHQTVSLRAATRARTLGATDRLQMRRSGI